MGIVGICRLNGTGIPSEPHGSPPAPACGRDLPVSCAHGSHEDLFTRPINRGSRHLKARTPLLHQHVSIFITHSS